MNDSNDYKSLLPSNTDFLEPSSDIIVPTPDISQPIIETGLTGSATPPALESEGPKYQDREEIIKNIGERIDGFFGFARVRTGRIKESTEAVKSGDRPLDELKTIGNSTKRTFQEVRGDTAEEAATHSAQVFSLAEQQIDDTFRTLQSIETGEQLDYIKTNEGKFSGDALEKFKDEIREALKIEDPTAREDALVALNDRIRGMATRIEERASQSKSRSLRLQQNTQTRTAQISQRIESQRYILPTLREKLGDSYNRVAKMAQDMDGSFQRFRMTKPHFESLPLEFDLLAQAAYEMRMDVAEVFAALGAGKYS